MTQPEPALERVDVAKCKFDIHRDLSVSVRPHKYGPPERIDGMTVGIISVTGDAPHNGEMHPNGDEILYVVSGRFRVTGESDPDSALVLEAGGACVVRKGEWHKVTLVEPGQLIHITPGPDGDYRPL